MNIYIIIISMLVCIASATFRLEPYSTLYLPESYDASGDPVYVYGGDAIEDAAYDSKNGLVYTAGDTFMNVIDVTRVTSPQILHSQPVTSDTPLVAICGSYVVFLSKNTNMPWMDGTLSIYNKYNRANPGVFTKVQVITVGPEPESIAFTSNCQVAVVANAATPEEDEQGMDIMDPEGSVSIIEFDGGDLSKEPTTNTKVNFVAFDSRVDEYVNRGVRFVYKGQISTRNTPTLFSQDLTPEYVVLNDEGTKAYVCLQMNNAIAVIDIASRTVDEIYPLGAKTWDMLDIDVSDMDGGINFSRWPMKTLYQPDEIRYFSSGGEGYIVTANEGDPFDISLGASQSWTDAVTGGQLTSDLLSPNFDGRVRDALTKPTELRNHEFSLIDGLDANGNIEVLHGFGGRGISVYRASDFIQVYDSGDSVAEMHARDYPAVFNADDEPDNMSPEQLMDTRSTKQGVDCESLEIGVMDGKRLVFVGADRVGTIMIFSSDKNSVQLKLESVYRNGSTDRPIRELFNDRMLNDAAPEALTFIPASSSSESFPMLMVAGTESGTLSFYKVLNDGSGSGSPKAFGIVYVILLAVLTHLFS